MLRCPVFDELVGLAVKTTGIADVLRTALLPHADRIHIAFVYGSVVRQDHTAESDIDLLLIGDASPREMLPVLAELETTLAREINALTLTEAEFAQRVADNEPFMTSVLGGPMIFLIGDREQLEALVR